MTGIRLLLTLVRGPEKNDCSMTPEKCYLFGHGVPILTAGGLAKYLSHLPEGIEGEPTIASPRRVVGDVDDDLTTTTRTSKRTRRRGRSYLVRERQQSRTVLPDLGLDTRDDG